MRDLWKYNTLLDSLRKPDYQLEAMYPYGSRVYGTAVEGSDQDFITVLKNMPNRHEILDREGYSFILHDATTFQRGLWAHECYAIECFFLDSSQKLKDREWDFKVDKRVLRESFSQKASHSFVKAKKKIEVERDFKRGKKSLFHSLRILTFGIQVATTGEIQDYQAANDWWWEIYTNPSETWEDYLKIYRPVYNGLCTKFREVCPK